MASLLQRAHEGERPDDLLVENWIDAEKTTEDDMGEDGIAFDNGSAVILADLDDEEEESHER